MSNISVAVARAFSLQRLLPNYKETVRLKFNRAFGDATGAHLFKKLTSNYDNKVDDWFAALDSTNTHIFLTHEAFSL